MARELGVRVSFQAMADRTAALPGADFVTTSIAVDLKRRMRNDWLIARRHGILQTAGECGSLGGLSYTLRSVPLALSVCRDMERLCPNATLLNVTNPLTRVALAANRYTSVRAIGFCYNALVGLRAVAEGLGKTLDELEYATAGLNHLSWLTGVRDRATGADLYCYVRALADEGWFWPVTRKYLRETGYLPCDSDGHMNEFLPFDDSLSVAMPEFGHGSPMERAERRALVLDVACGKEHWDRLHHSWERPGDYVSAVVRNKPTYFDFLNVMNDGYIDGLARDMVVQVPATVDGSGIRPHKAAIPEGVLRLLVPAAEASHWAVEAAVHADMKAAHRAIDADPAIADKSAARAAFAEMLEANRDILPDWQ
jgi:alpha-galactosidase